MMDKFNDKIYSDLLFRLVDSTDLKPYAIYYDKQSDEFFYTVRFETDAIVINNNRFESFICLWDYQYDKRNEEGVSFIKRFLEKDDMSFITQCKTREECINTVKELDRIRVSNSLD